MPAITALISRSKLRSNLCPPKGCAPAMRAGEPFICQCAGTVAAWLGCLTAQADRALAADARRALSFRPPHTSGEAPAFQVFASMRRGTDCDLRGDLPPHAFR